MIVWTIVAFSAELMMTMKPLRYSVHYDNEKTNNVKNHLEEKVVVCPEFTEAWEDSLFSLFWGELNYE